ncbi:hypothetical protein COB52_02285 [Candidatus Kaiserbacteria bacterium]|nr:MAG: hypothetical protein COB52_02285 [Candidatus Kaiserbacteria bacterium]
MRIDISAQRGFFKAKAYPRFEKLLAGAAAGCISVGATNGSDPIDVQVNQVLMASHVGQYIFTSGGNIERFGVAPRGRSLVTIEIDHVAEQKQGLMEDLLCRTAVALVAHFYNGFYQQNCWLKYYGGEPGSSGFCDDRFSDEAVTKAHAAVESFVNGNSLKGIMAKKLIEALTPNTSKG